MCHHEHIQGHDLYIVTFDMGLGAESSENRTAVMPLYSSRERELANVMARSWFPTLLP